MYFGVMDKPGAEELEKFAAFLLAGFKVTGERYDRQAGDFVEEEVTDDEIAERINEYLRHGNC